MIKLKSWQTTLLIIFFPIGIIYFLYYIFNKYVVCHPTIPIYEYSNTPNSKYNIITIDDNDENNKYEFITIKVAGVSFMNGNKSRQTILRKIKFRDSPFEKEAFVNIKEYEYEGDPAYGVYVNDEQIGNIPKNFVQYLKDNWERTDTITAIDVYGGGRMDNGENRKYGATITIRLFANK